MVCRECGKVINNNKSGFCRKHYIKNSPYFGQHGVKNHNWKGGTWTHNGYIAIRSQDHPYAKGNGYVFEHRLVMEQKIGRYLEPHEVVHHINGIRTDNRVENLELVNSNSEHHLGKIKHPWLKKFCKECGEKHYARDYCGFHYYQYFRSKDPNAKRGWKNK